MVSVALFQPEIPHNLGTNIRTCACLGCKLNIIEPCSFPMTQRNLKRSAVGSIKLCQIETHTGWDNFKKRMAEEKKRLVIFSISGKTEYTKFKFRNEDVLLFGKESNGLPEYIHKEIKESVYIKVHSKTRCLNVAVSLGIGLAEAIRQIKNIPSSS